MAASGCRYECVHPTLLPPKPHTPQPHHTHTPTHITQGVVVHTSLPHPDTQAQPPPQPPSFLLLDDGTGLVHVELAAVLQSVGPCAIEGLERGTNEGSFPRTEWEWTPLNQPTPPYEWNGGMDPPSLTTPSHPTPTRTHTGAYAMAVGVPSSPPSTSASTTDAAPCSVTAHQCLSLAHDPLREPLWTAEVIASWTADSAGGKGKEGVGLGLRQRGGAAAAASSLAW